MKTKIYKGNCLEVMQTFNDKSVDMILCDLPYGVLNRNNPEAQWDNIIDIKQLWIQYRRIIKDNGAIILFGQGMFTAQLMMSAPDIWRYNLVWDKIATTGFLNADRMPLRSHEDIMVFYKALPTYNPQMIKCDLHKIGRSRKGEIHQNNCYGETKDLPIRYSDERFPTSIISFNKVNMANIVHPTQKPVNLLRYLILTYSNKGDTILDNTMGSGSTGVACIKEQRNFIGIELNDKYFEIAKKRIEEAEKELTLF